MGDNPGYAIAIVNKEEYVLKHLPEDSTLVGSMESWKKQYVKVLQGNSNISKCKIIELIEKFPRNTIAVEDYLNDNDLQVIVDWLLSNGMYLRLCKPTKCFEFYCEYYL